MSIAQTTARGAASAPAPDLSANVGSPDDIFFAGMMPKMRLERIAMIKAATNTAQLT